MQFMLISNYALKHKEYWHKPIPQPVRINNIKYDSFVSYQSLRYNKNETNNITQTKSVLKKSRQ